MVGSARDFDLTGAPPMRKIRLTISIASSYRTHPFAGRTELWQFRL